MRHLHWFAFMLMVSLGFHAGRACALWGTEFGELPADAVYAQPYSGDGRAFQFNYLRLGGLRVDLGGRPLVMRQVRETSFIRASTGYFINYSVKMPGVYYHSAITGLMTGILAYLMNNPGSSIDETHLSQIHFIDMVADGYGAVTFTVGDGLAGHHIKIFVTPHSYCNLAERRKFRVTINFNNDIYEYAIELKLPLVAEDPVDEKSPLVKKEPDESDDDGAACGGYSGLVGKLVSRVSQCCSRVGKSSSVNSAKGSYHSTKRAVFVPVPDVGKIEDFHTPLKYRLGIEVLKYNIFTFKQPWDVSGQSLIQGY